MIPFAKNMKLSVKYWWSF